MEDIGEFQAKISGGRDDRWIGQFTEEFDKEWESSVDIERLPLQKYKQLELPTAGSRLHPDLKALLKLPKEKVLPKGSPIEAIILTRHRLSNRTEQIISASNSHWHKRNWEYYGFQSKREFERERGARCILLIEKQQGRYAFSKIQVLDSSTLATPDGKYFIAYKKISKTKRESKELRARLLALGVNYRSHKFNAMYRFKNEVRDLFK